jgi:hypothetical protein
MIDLYTSPTPDSRIPTIVDRDEDESARRSLA